jgi:uncharacterized protein YggE
MKSKFTLFTMIVVLIAGLTLFSGVVAAQDDGGDRMETITVVGQGSASGSPDIANLEVGVESFDADVAVAFSNTNATLQTVIDTVVEAGVAREDIRTTGLNIYYREDFNPAMSGMIEPGQQPQPNRTYVVGNRVRITVRDIDQIENVITAAINAGANNVFGPDFGFSDRAALESEARTNAMENARARAEELAALAGVELGNIVMINESTGGFSPFDTVNMSVMEQGFGGGGGAVIEPGTLSVNVNVQVSFAIIR